MTGHRHPTLDELRTHAQKGRHREIGNWLARRVARPSAVYGTWLAIRLGLSAHQVTLLGLAAGGASALAIMTGSREGFVAGVVLAHLAFWLDHVDGQVARWRGTSSLDGVYFDYLMHHAANLALGFALGYGLAAQGGDLRWTAAGFAIAAGWAGQSLHNDCRYKAFFQRLKRETRSFRVAGGSGGTPEPPARWPGRGRAAWTWPAYKACEPHVVLIGLTALAVVLLLAPPAGWMLWRGGVGVMSVLAPLLAFGRSARAIARRSTSSEFDRWFRPLDTTGGAVTMGQDHETTSRPHHVQHRSLDPRPLAGDAPAP
jgi:hypothetical protein